MGPFERRMFRRLLKIATHSRAPGRTELGSAQARVVAVDQG